MKMRFDVNRMATLAGFKTKRSGLLREGKEEQHEEEEDTLGNDASRLDEMPTKLKCQSINFNYALQK